MADLLSMRIRWVDDQGRLTLPAYKAMTAFTAGGVLSVSANAPLSSTGGTSPVLSISAATAFAAGSLSATDKVKLDNLSGTNTGDQTSVVGNAGTATALQTARNINGVSFNGTADITVTAAAATLTGLGAGVAAFLGTPSSANLATALTDELGSGSAIFGSEGTWTPVLTFGTPGNLTVAYSRQVGMYKRFGNVVCVWFEITTSTFTHTTASGNLNITGLPVAASATLLFTGPLQWQGITKASYTAMTVNCNAGSSTLTVRASGSGQTLTAVDFADTPTGGTVVLNGFLCYAV